jgi:hypothetical protein
MKRLIGVFCLTALGVALLIGVAAGEVKLVKGQTIYVPCYTSFMGGSQADSHAFEAKPTIFIHNTDQNNPINLVRMDFYNTNGKLVEKYLQAPKKLNANSSTRINVKELLKGEEGSGAHFIIQWQAENKVVEPLVQTWSVGAVGTRGYSFTAPARIIQEDTN